MTASYESYVQTLNHQGHLRYTKESLRRTAALLDTGERRFNRIHIRANVLAVSCGPDAWGSLFATSHVAVAETRILAHTILIITHACGFRRRHYDGPLRPSPFFADDDVLFELVVDEAGGENSLRPESLCWARTVGFAAPHRGKFEAPASTH